MKKKLILVIGLLILLELLSPVFKILLSIAKGITSSFVGILAIVFFIRLWIRFK